MAEKKKDKEAEAGISYVCRYRLHSLYKKLIHAKRLDNMIEMYNRAKEKVARDEEHNIEVWHERYGLYKWSKKPED